jgi:flavin reductase (DIM6/NTAB) family NADH-FMN oxidoreductase RutF
MSLTKVSIKKAFTFIEPGPVVLVTTNDGHQNNIMTISWHMVMDFTPRIALSTGPWNHFFETLMKTKECVIATPTVDLAKKVIGIGTVSGGW